MTKYVQVESNKDLIRDITTMGIINKNKAALDAAKEQKRKRLQKDNEIDSLKKEIAELKTIVSQILAHVKKD